MPGISDTIANTMLDNQYATGAAFLALFTTNPNFQTGSGGTEATGGGYARISLTMAAASGRSKSNSSGPHEFVAGTNIATGTYTGFGIYSASSGGTFKGGAAFGASRTLASAGDKISYAASSVVVSLPNS